MLKRHKDSAEKVMNIQTNELKINNKATSSIFKAIAVPARLPNTQKK